MADEGKTSTYGFDHVGLSVRDLASSREFFCDCLGWHIVGERPDYPTAFVSDGYGVLTLWQVESSDQAVEFNRRANVGLHHLAVAVVDRAGLDALYQRVSNWRGVIVEFSPQLSGAEDSFHGGGAERRADRVYVRPSLRGPAQGAMRQLGRPPDSDKEDRL